MSIKINLPLAPKTYLAAAYDDILRVLRLAFNQIQAATIDFFQGGSGAVGRSVQDKLREIPSVKDFGAVGDGVSDDTIAIQRAIDAVKTAGTAYSLTIPEGTYRCTSTLNITNALALTGQGVSPYESVGTRGNGSWLYFDHTGKGINIDGTTALSGITLDSFGTFRNQPAPGGGWTPNAHDYDIYIDNADVYIPDLMLLNPTKGIFITNGTAGRLEIGRLRGQAFQTMIRISESYDVTKLNNIHQWPFWKDDTNVHAYTKSNLDVIYMERNDNPMLANVFTIFARAGLRFGLNAAGKTSKVHLVNADFDRGAYGVWVDSTVTSGVTGQLTNITHQGETGLAGSKAVYIQGNDSQLDFVNFRTDLTNQNAVRVEGTGNNITFAGQTRLLNYDQSTAGFPAVEALTGNVVRIEGMPDIAGGGGAGGRYGGAGTIYVDEWRAYTPTVTSGTGTITTVGAVSGVFKRYDNTLSFNFEVNITTNGTGGGSVNVTVPDTITTTSSVAVGREVNASGKILSGMLTSSTARCDLRNYDNTYPGADGTKFVATGSYRIA
jgi:hypothetical protein